MDLSIVYFLNSFTGRSITLDAIIIFVARDLPYLVILSFLIWVLHASYTYREKIKMIGTVLISAATTHLIVIPLIHLIYQRPRPFLVYHIHPLLSESSYSFPSGHASFFFAFSTAVFFYNKKLGVFFFITTLFITLARVTAGVHYPSDIMGGMCIGVLVAYGIHEYLLAESAHHD